MTRHFWATLLLFALCLCFAACGTAEQTTQYTPQVASFSFEQMVDSDGKTIIFPMFRPDTTKESFEQEFGMSWDDYSAALAASIDADTGKLTGEPVVTVEGVPAIVTARFDSETGTAATVMITFIDDGRSQQEWDALAKAWNSFCDDYYSGDKKDGNTSVDRNDTSTDPEVTEITDDTPKRMDVLLLSYK